MVVLLEAAVALLLFAMAALCWAGAAALDQRRRWLLEAGVSGASLLAVVLAAVAVRLAATHGPARWTLDWAPWPGSPVSAGIETGLLNALLTLGAAAATALATVLLVARRPTIPATARAAPFVAGGLAVLVAVAPDVIQLAWLAGLLSTWALWLHARRQAGQPRPRAPIEPTAGLAAGHLVLLLAGMSLLLAAVQLAQASGSSVAAAIVPAGVPVTTAVCVLAAATLALGLPLYLLEATGQPLTAQVPVLLPAIAGGWVLLWRVDGLAGGPEQPAPLLVLLGLGISARAALRLVSGYLHTGRTVMDEALWRAMAGDLLGVALVGIGAGERGWPGAAMAQFAGALLLVERMLASHRAPVLPGLPVASLPAALVARCLAYWAAADGAWLAAPVLLLAPLGFGMPVALLGYRLLASCRAARFNIRRLIGEPRAGLLAISLAAAIFVRPFGVLFVGDTAIQTILPAAAGDVVAHASGLTAVELAWSAAWGLLSMTGASALLFTVRRGSRWAQVRGGLPEALLPLPDPVRLLEQTVLAWHALLQALYGRYYIIAAVLLGVAAVVLLAQ
jgi:hypothetical protein